MQSEFKEYYDEWVMDYESDQYMLPENRLWLAKVLVYFEDLQKIILKGRGFERRKRAEKWFLGDSEDFIFTCGAALLNPAEVKNAALRMIEENRLKMKAMGLN